MSREDSEAELPSTAMLEKFKDFNKEMERLKDDSNNNVIISEEITKETSAIPDLVISCPSDSDSLKVEAEEIKTDTTDAQKVEEVPKINLPEENEVNSSDIKDSNSNEISKTSDNEIVFHENKTLYITGSTDNLDKSSPLYTGKISLYITGSSDNLDVYNNNNDSAIENKAKNADSEVEIEACDASTPIPRQRKNKLTKNILLGI